MKSNEYQAEKYKKYMCTYHSESTKNKKYTILEEASEERIGLCKLYTQRNKNNNDCLHLCWPDSLYFDIISEKYLSGYKILGQYFSIGKCCHQGHNTGINKIYHWPFWASYTLEPTCKKGVILLTRVIISNDQREIGLLLHIGGKGDYVENPGGPRGCLLVLP